MIHSRAIVLALVFSLHLSAAKKPVTVEAVINAPPTRFPNVDWAPDGERYIEKEAGQLLLYDVKSGKERVVTTLDELERAAVKPPAGEAFDWTNRRVGEHEVQWFADGKRLLVAEGGDLFVVDVPPRAASKALTQTLLRRNAILNSRPTTSIRFVPPGFGSLHRRSVFEDCLSPDHQRFGYPSQRTTRLGISGRARNRYRPLVVARQPFDRVSAVRYLARAGVPSGVAAEHARSARARALPAAGRPER